MAPRSQKKGATGLRPEDLARVTEKLESSGLDMDDFHILGMEGVSYGRCSDLHPSFSNASAALKLNYFHPISGEPLASAPQWPAFYRLRYLDDVIVKIGEKEKLIRYVQEPGSGVCAYFPKRVYRRIYDYRTDRVKDVKLSTWADLPTESPIYITEGELKAAKGCKEGFPTIGLGGVFNFGCKDRELGFLPELELIQWIRRKVYIIFDSDIMTKPSVALAMHRLAEQLQLRGAICYCLILPFVGEGQKAGLDDFLVANGPEALELVKQDPETCIAVSVTAHLFEINERYAFVREGSLILDFKTGETLKPYGFYDTFAAMNVSRVVLEDGERRMKRVALGSEWFKWPLRRTVDKLGILPVSPFDIEPGQKRPDELTYVDADGKVCANLWYGWGASPAPYNKTELKPIIDLIDNRILFGLEPEVKKWFWQWLAYPIQRPTKLQSGVCIYSRTKGSGKGTLGRIMRGIYGPHARKIAMREITSRFNAWQKGAQFVTCDEAAGDLSDTKRVHTANMFKLLIDDRTVTIEEKGRNTYELDDYSNFLFTTNEALPFAMEEGDRRFFMQQVREQLYPQSEATVLWDLMENKNGYGKFMQYLLDVDTTDFNPHAPPPHTHMKDSVIRLGRSDVETWLADFRDDPVALLSRETRVDMTPLAVKVFSLTWLLELIHLTMDASLPEIKNLSAVRLARMLSGMEGFYKVNKGIVIKIPLAKGGYTTAVLYTTDKKLAEAKSLEKMGKEGKTVLNLQTYTKGTVGRILHQLRHG